MENKNISNTVIARKHDFGSKLMQPGVFEKLVSYVRWRREIRAVSNGRQIPTMPEDVLWPISINLDPTTVCNYACGHCIDRKILNAKVSFSHEKLLLSLENLIKHGLRSVILIGGGEPTLYPRFVELVKFLKDNKLQVAIVSNGSMTDIISNVACYLDKCDWVRYSIDAGTNQTFSKMHNPSGKKKIVSLDEVCDATKKLRKFNPDLQLGYSFVITWLGAVMNDKNIISNIDEVLLAATLAKQSGFSYISYKPFLSRGSMNDECLDKGAILNFNSTLKCIEREINMARTKNESEDFKVLLSTNLRLLLAGTMEDYTDQPSECHMTAFRQVLNPHGLFNCPAYRGNDIACIGVANAYASEISCNKTRLRVSEHIKKFCATEMCRNITCLYRDANWMIERFIQNPDLLSENTPLKGNDYFL